MDLGRAKYRQAHRLPPEKWEQGLFAFMVILLLALLATCGGG